MPAPSCKITVLGSGTSVGIPTIGCHCDVCMSTDPRDNRLRPSVLVSYGGRNILIDTTPDFRTQALRARIDHLDAVVFTHSHADHLMGLDDVRPFNFRQRETIHAFASPMTAAGIRRAFSYIWSDSQVGGGKPQIELHEVTGPFSHDGIDVIPIPVRHGDWTILGYRIGPFAYITDTNGIPDESLALLEGIDTLALDGLRPSRAHPTHFTIEEAVTAAQRIAPRMTYIIHVAHEVDHETVDATLPENIRLAWDGLELEFPE